MRQLELFPLYEISLEDVFQAYHDCRRHKRKSKQAQMFELDLENNLVTLWEQLRDGTYRIGPSTVFIVDRPVKREIFAAAFRDRIVHHLLMNALNPILEKQLVYDCYACRNGKGTHFGIQRLDHFMRSCSANYQEKAWTLKLDIRGFFMSIDRRLLFSRLDELIQNTYEKPDRDSLVHYCRMVVFNDPTHNCLVKSPESAWEGLPRDKSLFNARPGCGLPIGNLTSQVFANFYLSPLDHFIKNELGIRYYGRYVDDLVLVHASQKHLRACISRIRDYVSSELGLTLHPRKIRMQRVDQGISYLGCSIQVGHINAGLRWIHNWRQALLRNNLVVSDHKPGTDERQAYRATMNSYLGLIVHYDTYRIRCGILGASDPRWSRFFHPDLRKRKLVANRNREAMPQVSIL